MKVISKEQAQAIIDKVKRGECRVVNVTCKNGETFRMDLNKALYHRCQFIVSGLTEDEWRNKIDLEIKEAERMAAEVEAATNQQIDLKSNDDGDACTDTDKKATTYV